MSATLTAIQQSDGSQIDSIQQQLHCISEELMASLPPVERLSAEQRRGMIARYAAVLEGNFIYWMTGAYLSSKSEEARSIVEENLLTEVRDCHPGMLRRFVLAAHAAPRDSDALAVNPELSAVRLFIGRLSPVPIIAMMAFFEGFIQQFMAYLADLAERQGSEEMEYTDVHGVCDIAHSEELFRALEVEMAIAPAPRDAGDILEGVYLLQSLMQTVIAGHVH